MKRNWARLASLIVVVLAASACAPIRATPPVPTAASATPAPTRPPAATPTAAPEEAAATQYVGEQATIVARATQAPFPSAEPVALQAGEPSSATVHRGGLTLEVRLPKQAYLAGEAGMADLSVRNDGPETVFVTGDRSAFSTALLDAQGQEAPAWPWAPLSFPRPAYMQTLAPGAVITGTAVFHIPALVSGLVPSYALWVETRFSRPSPANAEGPDNVWLHLEAGPLALNVLEPTAEQRLQARLDVDPSGWKLAVTDAAGQAPPGPLQGTFEAATSNSLYGEPLPDNLDGAWAGTWEQEGLAGPAQIMARAWVSAPGYVTAVVSQTVPGTGDASAQMANSGPQVQSFATLEAAQAALGIDVFRLGDVPAGAALELIEAQASGSGDARWINLRQSYRRPDGAWLELTQLYTNQDYDTAGWGQARSDWEAQRVSVGGQPGYLLRRFGWWVLDWKIGPDGFELRASLDAISSEDLISVAAAVHR